MWLSNVHTWLNPYSSACRASSTTRADGGVVWRTTPTSTLSPVPGEAEVDGAGARVGPAAGDHLGPGVEVHALRTVHVLVAEQARLPPTEAVVADGHRNRHVDADHADVDL